MRTQPNNKPTWPLSSSGSLPLVPSPLDLSPDGGGGGGGLGEGGGRVTAPSSSVQGGVAGGELGGLVVGPGKSKGVGIEIFRRSRLERQL